MGVKTKYYVFEGEYMGAYGGVTSTPPKSGWVEVPHAPNNSMDKWNGDEWIPYEQPYDFRRKEQYALLDGDGMDAIRKEIQALRNGLPETEEYRSYREKIELIKINNEKT